MTSLREECLNELDRLEIIAGQASPGPWCYNSYSNVFSGPLQRTYDAWVDPIIDAGHTLEKRGRCDSCGDWKKPPWIPSPGVGHGCQHFDEDYERDPHIVFVPAHHGDTAIGRHQYDAMHMEANNPAVILRRCQGERQVLGRHTADIGYQALSHSPQICQVCRVQMPCPEVRAVAYRLCLDAPELRG